MSLSALWKNRALYRAFLEPSDEPAPDRKIHWFTNPFDVLDAYGQKGNSRFQVVVTEAFNKKVGK